MKKFYESPMVEFTVFDVEDVITLSILPGATMGMSEAEVTELVQDIETTLGVTVANKGNFSTYNW